jgi:hypothetical protein
MFALISGIGEGAPAIAGEERGQVDFVRDVRPILARNCLTCHGPDEEARQAGLRLDLREASLAELDSGAAAIVPGDPQRSELLVRITSDDDSLKMPPSETGHTLTDEEVALLRRWIQRGAEYAEHWAFEPLVRPAVPRPQTPGRIRNAVDAFVLSRLDAEGIAPNPEADRLTLIRRLSLDLTGLPPSPDQVREFLADARHDAYEWLVNRLLDSPHFGERWARHWLDLARFADSDGYLGDDLRPYAYRYRDWVIDSVNRDQPFDRFTIDQLAGDLVESPTPQQHIATGFHRNAMKNTEAGFDPEADRVIRTVDRTSTVGTVWMGLTIGCAECHSHKYDPVTHREFYELYAFFNNLEDRDLRLPADSPGPSRDHQTLPDPQDLEELGMMLLAAETEAEVAPLLKILASPAGERSAADREKIQAWLQDLDPQQRSLADRYELTASRLAAIQSHKAPAIVEADTPRATFVHLRGDFRQPGEPVKPSTPAFLHPLQPRGERPDRLDLARWLVAEQNPLTPRTTVNHIWKHLFGRGIVDTEDNLGISGATPSHPELLDWLAAEFVEQGWSRKAMIRLIVCSKTYRQSSRLRDDLRVRDPHNILLARQSRFRVEAELVRDQALAASGLLSRTIGGPSILPPLNSRLTEVSRNRKWDVSQGADKYRRGMYILFRRATPYPMLTLFDAPDATTACAARERSNSPLQALTLLNDPVFVECSRTLGRRLAELGDVACEEWLTKAVWECLSRPPQEEELQRLVEFHAEQRQLLQEVSPEQVRELTGPPVEGLDPREHAARVTVARGLMNLDEFITRP